VRQLLLLPTPPPGVSSGALKSGEVRWEEAFDVGSDAGTRVDDKDYRLPFRFTGKIAKLTFKLGPEQLTEADRKEMHKHIVRAKD
jgi:hypothetical protein